MKYREKFNEKLKLLEQKMEDSVFFKAGELSALDKKDKIMVSRSLLII